MLISRILKLSFGLLLLLLAPQTSLGLSGENMAYIGYLSNGKIVNVEYLSGPNEKNNWTWLFGDKTNNNFKTCWLAEKDNFGYLTCADKYNGKTSVIYKPLDENYKPTDENHPKYGTAIRKYKKMIEDCSAGVMGILICGTGCKQDMPKFMFEVGYDGTGCE